MYGRDSLISVLLSDPRIDPGARSLRQCTPLHEAARQGHVSAVRLLTADARVDVNALGQDFREDNVRWLCAGRAFSWHQTLPFAFTGVAHVS